MAKFCPYISQVMMLPGKISGSAEIQLIGMPCQGLACLAWDPEKMSCALLGKIPQVSAEIVDTTNRH